MVEYSSRWVDGGERFGFYDKILAADNALEFLGIDNIPLLSDVEIESNSGLNNTVFVSGDMGGVQ